MSVGQVDSELFKLAEVVGVTTSYYDISGEVHYASPDSLVAVLRSLGVPLNEVSDLSQSFEWFEVNYGRRPVPPVLIAWDGQLSTPVHGNYNLQNEEGGASFSAQTGDSIPFGYYKFMVEADDHITESFLISAPSRCYEPTEGTKKLGLFCPFYALHSKSSLGVGDFGDARELLRWAGKKGIGILGSLPLSAQFLSEPCEPSPYQPASRLFWNELYLDIRRLPEFKNSAKAHRIVASADFLREVESLNASKYVDYYRVAKAKREIVEILASEILEKKTARRYREFKNWAGLNQDAVEYARFRAERESGDPSEYEKITQYHLYTQWITVEQLQWLIAEGEATGVQLYLDLPLGSHSDGFDLWKHSELFVTGMSIGAPPDPLGPEGQVWGLPPINPLLSSASGHSFFRSLIRRHTTIAGMLRIDHVMGIHRLFWVPDGMPGSAGVYVRYPAEDLWAIIALESHRNKCVIVGEDLGTVPDEVRIQMDKRGVRRLYILPFEVDSRRDQAINQPSPDSIASLNTHDLVPYAGFWKETDIDDRAQRGWLTPESEASAREERAGYRNALSDSFPQIDFFEADRGAGNFIRESHAFLARSEAEVVLLNIEDLWGEIEPQNRPGTVDPVPNWRRKLSKSIEEIMTDPNVVDQIKELTRGRGKGMERMTKIKKNDDTQVGSKPRAKTVKVELSIPKIESTRPVFRLTDDDRYLFNEGSHLKLYQKLGAHPEEIDGISGVHFAVWAPDAESVHVIGGFNEWNRSGHPLAPNNSSGIWEGFIPGVTPTTIYKYFVKSRFNGYQAEKADPFAFHAETSPKTGSVVWDLDYQWNDSQWMGDRGSRNRLDSPISIYELHLGSWRRVVEQGERSLSYRELADQLPDYLTKLGFTHVEFLPLMEHPFYGSWGYQTTGYFAPTSRYGTPQDLMFLIDTLHQHGIGVILDWVPSHFPSDEHGLAYFDGTHLYEHADTKQGFHPDWKSMIFNYGRNEVRSFLMSSGMFWLDKYHADGLRVDAVASMLYLDYSRKAGEWIPNKFGGRENLEAISFLRRFNEEVYSHYPDVQIMAEESTSWPAVSRPTYLGGLGFGLKWDMGWMHDMLDFLAHDPIHRQFHHSELTFRMLYAWHENFVLPLSHDEVVHGKGSLIGKMPGDIWQKFANLRLLFLSQFTQPGKKLIFMGDEIGQWSEWNHDSSLDWHLLEYPNHAGLLRFVGDLNRLYRNETAMHELDCESQGFEWIDCNDASGSTLSFLRWNRDFSDCLLIALNFTPVTHFEYRVGVPRGGKWKELLNSDSEHYAGSGKGNFGEVGSTGIQFHGRPDSIVITLPPLGGVILKG